MKKFSINAAAKETGKSTSVISNAIKNGKLSADKVKNPKTGKFSYAIDPSELFRVFPKESPENTEKKEGEYSEVEKKAIRKYREAVKELELMKATVEDLRNDKEYLQNALRKEQDNTKLIANQMQPKLGLLASLNPLRRR